MKPEHDFTAARAIANHCRELFRDEGESGPSLEERQGELLGDICRDLVRQIPPLLAARSVQVAAEDNGSAEGATILRKVGAIAANYTVVFGDPAIPLLVSFDLSTAVSLTDRLFGGDGKIDDEVPAELPEASALSLEKIARAFGSAIGRSALNSDDCTVAARNGTLSRLNGFDRAERYARWTMTVRQEGYPEWSCLIGIREADLAELLTADTGQDRRTPQSRHADAASVPFGSIPFSLRAELASIKLPLSRLRTLKPGDVLPVPLAREVPLFLAQQELARGTVGQIEDRIALRLVQLSRKGIEQ